MFRERRSRSWWEWFWQRRVAFFAPEVTEVAESGGAVAGVVVIVVGVDEGAAGF